ncbi:MAG: hypothetical protein R2707_15460 [Acidimicrobiales bacterium]
MFAPDDPRHALQATLDQLQREAVSLGSAREAADLIRSLESCSRRLRAETRPHNGGPFCGRHNRHKQKGFAVWRDPSGVWHTYRPDGSEI